MLCRFMSSRSLVQCVNEKAPRRKDLVTLRKGVPVKERVKGRGRYKSFTPKTMLQTTLPGSICMRPRWFVRPEKK